MIYQNIGKILAHIANVLPLTEDEKSQAFSAPVEKILGELLARALPKCSKAQELILAELLAAIPHDFLISTPKPNFVDIAMMNSSYLVTLAGTEEKKIREADGRLDWTKIDLSRPTGALAKELGISRQAVDYQKKKAQRSGDMRNSVLKKGFGVFIEYGLTDEGVESINKQLRKLYMKYHKDENALFPILVDDAIVKCLHALERDARLVYGQHINDGVNNPSEKEILEIFVSELDQLEFGENEKGKFVGKKR